jgi:biopolymer transport protein ExbD
MEFRTGRKKRSLVINVTSLIDVMFNLVLFFMVSTTFLSQPAIKLELPEAMHAEVARQTPLVVYVDPEGQIYLNDEPIAISLLGEALKRKLADDADKAVVLKADSRVSHGAVIEVLDVLKGSGVKKLTVATRSRE